MKHIHFLFLLSLLLGMSSCNEEIDLGVDGRKTAIVYGLLDQADSIHYIKITRAFGSGNNASVIAQIPDSSYFPVLTATVSEVYNGNVTRTWTLKDTILTNKQPGAFYSPEQKVYYFKANDLLPSATYKLDVDVNNGEFHVYGETPLVKSLTIQPSIATDVPGFSFASYDVTQDGYRETTITVSKGTSQILDGRIEVFFNEYIAGVPTEKSFIWKLGEYSGSDLSNLQKFVARGALFYPLIRDNATDNPAIHKRTLTRFKVSITGGTADLATYLLVNKPSSSLAQNKPYFTNLTASNDGRVIGVFAARNTVVMDRPAFVNAPPHSRALNANSTKELCIGMHTAPLFFCSDIPLDVDASYACQ